VKTEAWIFLVVGEQAALQGLRALLSQSVPLSFHLAFLQYLQALPLEKLLINIASKIFHIKRRRIRIKSRVVQLLLHLVKKDTAFLM
jgi:hypothetical protein